MASKLLQAQSSHRNYQTNPLQMGFYPSPVTEHERSSNVSLKIPLLDKVPATHHSASHTPVQSLSANRRIPFTFRKKKRLLFTQRRVPVDNPKQLRPASIHTAFSNLFLKELCARGWLNFVMVILYYRPFNLVTEHIYQQTLL